MTISGQAVPRLVAISDATSRDPARLLPGMINIDDTDTPGDMLDALALAAYLTTCTVIFDDRACTAIAHARSELQAAAERH